MDNHEHISKADNNLEFLNSFYNEESEYYDWIITILFYSALHYIEAYFALRTHIGGTEMQSTDGEANHSVRKNLVRRFLKSHYHKYKTLYQLSIEARYTNLSNDLKWEDIEKYKYWVETDFCSLL